MSFETLVLLRILWRRHGIHNYYRNQNMLTWGTLKNCYLVPVNQHSTSPQPHPRLPEAELLKTDLGDIRSTVCPAISLTMPKVLSVISVLVTTTIENSPTSFCRLYLIVCCLSRIYPFYSGTNKSVRMKRESIQASKNRINLFPKKGANLTLGSCFHMI